MDSDSRDASTDEELEALVDENKGEKLLYNVDDSPSNQVTLFLAIQQLLTNFSGNITLPIILSEVLCASHNHYIKIRLLSGMLITSGISTCLIVMFGIRLPVFQGSNTIIVAPIIAAMEKCPDFDEKNLTTNLSHILDNIFYDKISEFQGGLIIASIVEVILGATGLVGYVMRFVGPLTIAPIFFLIGPSLLQVCVLYSKSQWGLSFLTMGLVFIFSLILGRIQVPFPSFDRIKGFHIIRYPIFQTMPVFFSIILAWFVCGVLTWTNVLSENPQEDQYRARVDVSSDVEKTPWFVFPYPGQLGLPRFTVITIIGSLIVILCSVLESVGDYTAVGDVCQASPVPKHAINRGIMVEGFGCIIGALMVGAGMTTSYSTATGIIKITKVASRKVLMWTGVLQIMLGFLGKFGAFMMTMPYPVIGGISIVGLSMVSSIGLSMIEHINMKSSRNLCVLGMALFLGIMVPEWFSKQKHIVTMTGNSDFDTIFQMLLAMPLFVSGSVAFILDNSLPGTLADRGMENWCQSSTNTTNKLKKKKLQRIYAIPFITEYLIRCQWTRFVPIFPTSDPSHRKSLSRKMRLKNLKQEAANKFG